MMRKRWLNVLLLVMLVTTLVAVLPSSVSAYYQSEKYTTQPWPAINARPYGCGAIGFGQARYFSLIGCMKDLTTEAWGQMKMYSPHTFSKANVYVLSNSLNGAATLTSRVNGGNGNISVTIGAGVTGLLQDLTHTDSLVSGDYFNWQLTCGGSTGSIILTYISCDATGKYMICAAWEPAINPAEAVGPNGNKIWAFGGAVTTNLQGTWDVDWPSLEYVFGGTAVFSNLRVYISANTLNGATYISPEKNHVAPTWVAGDMVVTVPAASTGGFENTSSTHTYSSGDKGMYLMQTQASTSGAITALLCQADVDYDGTIHIASHGHGGYLGSVQTRYVGIDGSDYRNPSETGIPVTITQPYTVRRVSMGIQNNNAAGTYTLTFRVNGAPTALSVSTSATGNGLYVNTGTTVRVAPGDNVSLVLVCTGAVNGASYLCSVEFIPDLTPDPAPPPPPPGPAPFGAAHVLAFIVLFVLVSIPLSLVGQTKLEGPMMALAYFAFIMVAIMLILIPWLTR